jgi:peptide/nickel transport system substrate-binding protein
VERIALNRANPDRATEDGERASTRYPHPFFSDPRVRQAFSLAIDREAIVELYGPGRPRDVKYAHFAPNVRVPEHKLRVRPG